MALGVEGRKATLTDIQNNNHDDDYDHLLKLLALGDGAVGKTAFLHRYTEGTFIEKYVSTVGIDYRGKRVIYQKTNADGSLEGDKRRVYLKLWDTCGQERFLCLTTAFFRDAMGFLLMFDITQQQSFYNVRTWLQQIYENASDNFRPVVILIGNKCDLEAERTVEQSDAEALASSLGVCYFETSAKTGVGVEEAVATLLDLIMVKMEEEEETMKSGMNGDVDLKEDKETGDETSSNCAC